MKAEGQYPQAEAWRLGKAKYCQGLTEGFGLGVDQDHIAVSIEIALAVSLQLVEMLGRGSRVKHIHCAQPDVDIATLSSPSRHGVALKRTAWPRSHRDRPS